MEKKIAQILPTTIVGYENKDYLDYNTKLLKCLENYEFFGEYPKQTKDNHLHLNPDFKELFDWIDICLEDYRKSFNYSCDSLQTVLSWVNKSLGRSPHHTHTHPNSFISGIYYLTENPSPTYFESPITASRNGIVVISQSPLYQNIWTCQANAGDLILFPSWLDHFTEPPEQEKTRMTLSFNIMPRGIVNKGTLIECEYN